MTDETPRRHTLSQAYADTQAALVAALTRQATEPIVTVEIDTTAKGESKPRVHIAAPVGCDLDALEKHVAALVVMAQAAYLDTQAPLPGSVSPEQFDALVAE